MLLWNLFDGLILVLLGTCVVVWPTQLISDRTNRWLRVVAVILVVVQLVVDGPRVQLVPAYLVALLFALLLVVDRARPRESSKVRERRAGFFKRLARWAVVLVTAVVVLASAVLCFVFPRFHYLAPSGQYAIATKELRLVDNLRPEIYTPRPDDHREIGVRVTYPAQVARELPQDTTHNDAAALFTLALQTSMVLNWGANPTHARIGAPISAARRSYPVLIFSHGFPTGSPEQNTVLIEHLASHGYIVMAINHSWQSLYYEFADHSTADLSVLRKLESSLGPPQTAEQLREEDALWAQLSDPKKASTEAQVDLIRKATAFNPRGTKFNSITHELISADQRFLMDTLGALQAGDPVLAGHLDLERIGVFGQSSGGTASQITCVADRRCRAGANLDGWQPLLQELPPLETPFLHMSSKDSLYRRFSYERSKGPSYFVQVKGASHLDYTDAMLSMSNIKRLGLLGSIPTERMYALTNDYVLAFFSKHLLGQPEPLVDASKSEAADVLFLSK